MAGRNRETSASILGWLGRSSVAPSIKQEQINLGDASVTSFANKSNKIWKTKKKEKKICLKRIIYTCCSRSHSNVYERGYVSFFYVNTVLFSWVALPDSWKRLRTTPFFLWTTLSFLLSFLFLKDFLLCHFFHMSTFSRKGVRFLWSISRFLRRTPVFCEGRRMDRPRAYKQRTPPAAHRALSIKLNI